jgi:hypothetical protein
MANDVTTAEIGALKAGLDTTLNRIEQALGTVVYAEQLPLVGTQIKEAFDAGEAALKAVVTLEGKIDGVLTALTDGAGYAASDVAQQINDAIATAGFAGTIGTAVNNGELTFNIVTNTTCAAAK